MSATVKLGIIGVGQIGKRHLATYAKIPGAEIVAVADIDEAEARRVAAEHDIPHVFTDFRELLALDEIEAVEVCLHNNLHAPVSIAALEAGKHVYCEKPMAGSYADAKAMYEAATRCGGKLSIQLASLFQSETKAARRLIEEGYLGKPYYAKSSYYRRRGRPYVDGYGTSSFVQKQVASGGALYDMGVYHIAQILYLLDNPAVATVTGATHQEIAMYEDRRVNGRYDVEELGIGLVRLDGGITFFIEESWAIHLGGTDGSKIVGTKGGLSLAPFGYFSTIADMEMDATFHLQSAEARWDSCFLNADVYKGAQQHWIAALQERVPLLPTAELALNTMLISEGIYLSQQMGREVMASEVEQQSRSSALAV